MKYVRDQSTNLSLGPQVSVLLWSVLQSRHAFFRPYTMLGFGIDYLLNVGTILLSFTLYAGSPLLLSGLLVAPAILVYALPANFRGRRKALKPPNSQARQATGPLSTLPTKPFLTTYRGFMIVSTCVAILAVDFRIFPRRFAKVETWGTSLMDMGVGSFVFSMGLVAARPLLKERAEGRATSLPRRLLHSMRHSLPLLVLGIMRLLTVKGVDYAEHVTEYGVHWNFFFTLGLLPPFVAAFQSALKIIPSYATMAVLLGITYQVILETTYLKAFVLTAPRTDLLSMNREGVFSFFGYLAIFLAGQDTGMFVLPRSLNPHSGSNAATQRNTLLMTMAIWCGIWSALYFFSTSYHYGFGLTVSRRLANLPYMLWVVSFNLAQVLAFAIIDTIFFPAFYNAADAKTERDAYETATSRVMRAFNRNGLAIFLIANLLTGLVNLTVPTLDVSPVLTMGILVGYTLLLSLVAVGLDFYNISIKL
jgi:glucosaminylphosphatidylinositol acyltransferase